MTGFTEQHIVAIDLGSSKIALIVAKVYGNDAQIIYYKDTPSAGIKNSGIMNTQLGAKAIGSLIKDAEDALNIKINQAVIGMPKWPVRQESNSGKIQDRGEYTEITQDDIDILKRFAQETYPLQAEDKEAIYGAVAQSFSDGENFQIKEDEIVGMASDVLEGHFKIFIGRKKDLTLADALLAKVGISARKKYFTADTTAQVVLSETEMENGVALVDFGGGSTSVTIYQEGIMRHYASIPFGGKNVTQDIRGELQITERLAENIKLAFGACMPDKLQNLSEKVLHILDKDNGQDKQVTLKYLSEIITARMEEIIEAILYEIYKSGFAEHLRCGIVITGGAAQTANLAMLINEMSGYKVRVGYPRTDISDFDIDGTHDTPAATVLGLVNAALKESSINCAIDRNDTAETAIEPVEVEIPAQQEAVPESTEPQTPAEQEQPEVPEETEVHQEETVLQEETGVQEETEVLETKTEKRRKWWNFGGVIWGTAQNIGEKVNQFIDGITTDTETEEQEDEE